jgi:hypothetical protein
MDRRADPTGSTRSRHDFINHAAPVASEKCSPVQVASAIRGQASARIPSVGPAGKAIHDRVPAIVSDSINDAATECASRVSSSAVHRHTVEATPHSQQGSARLLPIRRFLANVCRTSSVPVLSTLNTTPQPMLPSGQVESPPNCVTPCSSPLAVCVSRHRGEVPVVPPGNVYSVFRFPAVSILKMVPAFPAM